MISTLSNAAIYGGSEKDSVNITGSLYGATIDFGAGNELFSLTVGSSNSTIAGGAGNDTFKVNVAARTPPRSMAVPVKIRFTSTLLSQAATSLVVLITTP